MYQNLDLAIYIVMALGWFFIISQAPQVIGDTIQWGKDIKEHYTKEKSSGKEPE